MAAGKDEANSATREKAPAAAQASRAWTDYTTLPDLDDDAEAGLPLPGPVVPVEPVPFNKPIPSPRAPDPLQLPDFKRQMGPQNPILYRPIIPGTTDPLLAMQASQGRDEQSSISFETAGDSSEFGEGGAAADSGTMDIFMNRMPGSGFTSRLPAWVFIPLTAVGVLILLALVGWLAVAAFTSAGRFSGRKETFTADSQSYSATKAAARKLAENFLQAATLDQKLALVRDPERVRPLIESFKPSSPLGKLRDIRDYGTEDYIETAIFYHLATFESGRTRLVCVVGTPAGLKVDWEAYSRQGSATGEELLAGKPLTATVRVLASRSRYYNWAFADEKSYMAIEVSNADWPNGLTAYVKHDSDAGRDLAKFLKGATAPKRFVLKIRVDETTPERKQCAVEECVAAGWVYPPAK